MRSEQHDDRGCRVRFEPSGRVAWVPPGTSLLAAAAWARVPLASSCGGEGRCGECKVRVRDWELACQVSVQEDLTCEVPEPAAQPLAVVEGIRRPVAVERPDGWKALDAEAPLGLAVDLGTTTVAGDLVDLATGETVASGSRVNLQSSAGADVISRAAFAHHRPEGLRELRTMAVETMAGLTGDLCERAGVEPEGIGEVVVTGNGIMLHLLLGVDPHPLGVAPYTAVFHESREVSPGELGLPIHPRGRVVTFPLISAYAGGDTVAGLHATDVVRGDRPALLVDLGTNTEVVLGWGGRAIAAAAPAGPAFEGGGVRHGMPAVHGAVAHVRLDDQVRMEVVGGGEPGGICGSGLVDALAELRRTGLVDPRGRLASAFEVPGHPLGGHLEMVQTMRSFRLAEGLYLDQRDIRELQAALAAVSSAVGIVLEVGEVAPEELAHVFLAGSFGSALDPTRAARVGLVPAVEPGVVEGVGNAALEGARAALLSFREREAAFLVPAHVDYVELSGHPRFNDLFLNGMSFPAVDS